MNAAAADNEMPAMPAATAPVERTAVYCGTFDPITLGHLDVVRRAGSLFDRLVIAVAAAHHKKTQFGLEDRLQQARAATESMAPRGVIEVLPFDGLLVDFCARQQAHAVVRGIRNMADFDYEMQMAAMNRKLSPKLETVFLLPEASVQCISSTLVREISKLGGDVSALVTLPIAQALAAAHAAAASSSLPRPE